MHLWLRIFGVSVLTLNSIFISAQPFGFSLPVINNAFPGAIINPALSVTNFDSVTSLQFVLRWDPTVLQFQAVNTFNLDQMDDEDFGLTQAQDSGLIRIKYAAPSYLWGTSVPDGTGIFRIRFKVIGAANTGSNLQITESFPTAFEVTQGQPDSSIQAYPINTALIDNGFVAVGYTVSANEPVRKNDFPVQISPNPFTDNTTVAFHLETATTVHLTLTDLAGRIVRTEDRPLGAGDQSISISAVGLQTHGTYFLTLRTATQACVRTLFLF